MKVLEVAAALSACLLAGVDAEITYKKETVKKVREPLVEDCDALCVFENDNNSWCFETTPPLLRIGWDWEQKWDVTVEDDTGRDAIKYYAIKWNPYYELQVYLTSKFDISRLWYWEFTADLSKFKMAYFFSLLVNGDFYLCPGIGYSSDAIDF